MSKRSTTEEYIQKCIKAHGNRYDYSKLKYSSNKKKVTILCREHGKFKQWPSDHRRGFGCSKCSGKQRHTTKSFIKLAKKVHGDLYDYSLVDYKSMNMRIDIVCQKHGIFNTVPTWHIYGTKIGCPKCNYSRGENIIREFLMQNKIKFDQQKIFKELGSLRFDFYLPKHNACIEYDGAQHFHVRHQRTRNSKLAKQNFEGIKRRDKRKNEFCKLNRIKLIRIPYKQLNNIYKILNYEILCYSSQ